MVFDIGDHIVDVVLAEYFSEFGHSRGAVRDYVFRLFRAKGRRTREDSVEIRWAKWRVVTGLLIMAADALLFKNVFTLFYSR